MLDIGCWQADATADRNYPICIPYGEYEWGGSFSIELYARWAITEPSLRAHEVITECAAP